MLIGEKIVLITGDQKIIALNGKDGSLLWELLPLFQPTKRGILAYSEDDTDYLFLPISGKTYKINADNGKLIKDFGNKGHIKSTSNTAPMIYKESLVVLSPFGKVESFNKITGKK